MNKANNSYPLPNNHYNKLSIQPINIMYSDFSYDEYLGFIKGNILKYLLRLGKKDDVLSEAEKILVYANLLVKAIEQHEEQKASNLILDKELDKSSVKADDKFYESMYEAMLDDYDWKMYQNEGERGC